MTTDDYEYLMNKYRTEESKVATINGLLIAQALCSRKLMDVHSRDILDIMGEISNTIDKIKEGESEND